MMSKKTFLALVFVLLAGAVVFGQDPNFHIYLCFGQSNMEGVAKAEAQDSIVDERFQVFQALDCANLNREKEKWYTAVPPLTNCHSGLSPVETFGKTMVENLPENIKIGVVKVAIGGCDIRIFDKDIYQDYDSTYTQDWFVNKVKAYNGNPYRYLMDLAKLAQKDGVVKGILLHQGETNTGDELWPAYVKKIYNDMLAELSLNAQDVPLLAGETVANDSSCCASMNEIINKLPQVVPTAHIISSEGLTAQDKAHFDASGYREFGMRYANAMLSIMGIEGK